ncbi:MAG: mechanosensitive ion channel [Bacteroidales bacterium]|nr:mechanosensitive ion channel [Bacteroidales bacterium]
MLKKLPKSLIAGISVFMLALAPAYAVFKEKDLQQTLLVLLSELKSDHEKVVKMNAAGAARIQAQHNNLLKLVEQSNELSLMLYSQPQNYTFDLTYALHQVTDQYEKFDSNRMPFDEIIQNMSIELDRYSKLAQTLRNMPPVKIDLSQVPQLESVMDTIDVRIDTLLNIPSFALKEGFRMDAETAEIRDSCLFYAEAMVSHYMDSIKRIEEDSEDYADTEKLLKESYDYAQSRYHTVQNKVFLQGQRNYFKVLVGFGRSVKRAWSDLTLKYGPGAVDDRGTYSAWKGPIVAAYAFVMLVILIVAMILATFVVKLTIKKVKFFQLPYFQEHRGMLIALTGVVIFSIIIFFNANGGNGESFISTASGMMGEYAWLLAAIFTSMLIRLDEQQTYPALKAYLPTLILAFLVVFFRIIFIPNSALNIAFPLLVLLFTVWQFIFNFRFLEKLPRRDRIMLWISAVVMAASTVISWCGLVMMAVMVLIWWFFQLSLVQTVMAVANILDRNYEGSIKKRQVTYRKHNPRMPFTYGKGAYIEITWFHDLVDICVIPVLAIWTLPLAINLACDVFNLSTVATEFFKNPIINVEGVLHLSLFKFVMVLSLFFVFRYVVYATKSFYRVNLTRSTIEKMDENTVFKESDINFNLANNIITLVSWGIYVIIVFVMLKIPTSALTIITTGLATGIGFAMKDVLNNFFYGVQLMSGRVRVGDTIECDGIRGVVQGLSYQSTQVAAEDGSVIAFTNTALFNKNFKNLTRNHHYEMINFTVGVKYGTDVEKAREVIQQALQPLLGKDKYGREVVDAKKGINVRLKSFGDSSVDIQVLLFATVDVHYTFAAQAKEAIYNAFAENGIEIPFPQSDVYIKEMPSGKKA